MYKTISIHTTKKEELIDITALVDESVAEAKIQNGLCMICIPHTTAAITINENADPDVKRDILYGLKQIVPEKGYCHAEGNSTAHIKSSLLGCSGQVLVENGKPALGTWQGIYFCEFDGPRQRQIFVQMVPC